MLLGMLRIGECRGTQLLGSLGLDADEVRSEVGYLVKPGEREARTGELPYTALGKKVLELAMSAARERRDEHVGTEHLLIGMLNEKRGIPARALGAVGITATHVEALLAGKSPPPRESTPAGSAPVREARLRIEIDDRSDRSIYEQIVARVQEAVAVGEVSAGERLPPVRRLADRLDVAPGTVARAYGELEGLGVVVTDGARGTRIA